MKAFVLDEFEITEQEMKLIEHYRTADDDMKAAVRAVLNIQTAAGEVNMFKSIQNCM